MKTYMEQLVTAIIYHNWVSTKHLTNRHAVMMQNKKIIINMDEKIYGVIGNCNIS